MIESCEHVERILCNDNDQRHHSLEASKNYRTCPLHHRSSIVMMEATSATTSEMYSASSKTSREVQCIRRTSDVDDEQEVQRHKDKQCSGVDDDRAVQQ